jgi:hypothetical protein
MFSSLFLNKLTDNQSRFTPRRHFIIAVEDHAQGIRIIERPSASSRAGLHRALDPVHGIAAIVIRNRQCSDSVYLILNVSVVVGRPIVIRKIQDGDRIIRCPKLYL